MQISKYANNNEKGQSLFELVVSIAVSALIMVAIVSLVTNAIRSATFSRNNALAASYAQSTVEWLRIQRDSDINTFLTKVSLNFPAPTPYCFVDLSWERVVNCEDTDVIPGTSFVRQGVFTVTSPNGKTLVEANITVTWSDTQGTHIINNVTDFTDWRQR